jgi:hypothetical protein
MADVEESAVPMHTYETQAGPLPVKARVALVGLVAWAVLLVAFGPQLLRPAGAGGPGGAAAVEQGGVTFVAEDGRFRATFPSRPSRTQEPQEDPTNVIYETVVGKGSVGVLFSDFGADSLSAGREAFLRAYVDAWVDGKGTLVSSSGAAMEGNPALDFRYQAKDGRVFGRALVVGTEHPRVYLFLTTSDPSPELKAAYDRLIETFTLTG